MQDTRVSRNCEYTVGSPRHVLVTNMRPNLVSNVTFFVIQYLDFDRPLRCLLKIIVKPRLYKQVFS